MAKAADLDSAYCRFESCHPYYRVRSTSSEYEKERLSYSELHSRTTMSCSSNGRAPDFDSGGCGFEAHRLIKTVRSTSSKYETVWSCTTNSYFVLLRTCSSMDLERLVSTQLVGGSSPSRFSTSTQYEFKVRELILLLVLRTQTQTQTQTLPNPVF